MNNGKHVPTPDEAKLAEAEAYLDKVKHGKHAFMGSSSWSDFIYARERVDELRNALARAKATP